MGPVLVIGTVIVQLALAAYTIAVVAEQRSHRISRTVILFLSVGVVFDIAATTCMIIGSAKTVFSLHGLLGYSSLTGMLIETLLAWRHWARHGEATVSGSLHLYSRIAYAWWVVAYVTGALLVFVGR